MNRGLGSVLHIHHGCFIGAGTITWLLLQCQWSDPVTLYASNKKIWPSVNRCHKYWGVRDGALRIFIIHFPINNHSLIFHHWVEQIWGGGYVLTTSCNCDGMVMINEQRVIYIKIHHWIVKRVALCCVIASTFIVIIRILGTSGNSGNYHG